MVFGFFLHLWRSYVRDRKLRLIERRREELLRKLISGEIGSDDGSEWARLEHEERYLTNPAYRKQIDRIKWLNEQRKKRNR